MNFVLADYLLSVGNRYEQLYYKHGNDLSYLIFYEDTFPQLLAYVPFSAGTAIFCTVSYMNNFFCVEILNF